MILYRQPDRQKEGGGEEGKQGRHGWQKDEDNELERGAQRERGRVREGADRLVQSQG